MRPDRIDTKLANGMRESRRITRRTFNTLEAGVGIEPAYADLQSAAWPLCHPARGGSNQKGKRVAPPRILERAKSLELSTSTLARLRSTN